MSRRSRRRSKSRRNTLIALGVLVLIVVSAGGFYAYTQTTKPTSSTATTSTTGPYAILDTSQGTIVLQLFPQIAPKTVANFESLANESFYNDLVWHRIVPSSQGSGYSIIQTGDQNSRGAVNSTRSTWGESLGPDTEPLEVNSAYQNNAGYVGIAHTSSSTTGGSQFYINLTNNTEAFGTNEYTIFAKVVQGMNVVDAIAALPIYTNSSSPYYDQPVNANDALLISVTISSTE